VTLSAWKCGSHHLYGPQKHGAYRYPTGFEHKAKKGLEFFKEYELEVHYHPGKVNVVADALSRKAHYNYLPAL
jgi:hypothetical protein